MVDATRSRGHRSRLSLRKLLILMLTLSMVLTPFPRMAQAAPAEQVAICGINDPTCIEPYRPYNYGVLQDQILDDLITNFGIEDNYTIDPTHPIFGSLYTNLLFQYEYDLVNAALFDKLLGIINKNPSQRTTFEQQVVADLSERVRARREQAAVYAKQQYEGWVASPCGGWQPPYPFPAYTPSAGCTVIGGLVTNPKPPSFETFQQYGAAYVNRQFTNDVALQMASSNASKNYAGLGTLAGLGIATVTGGFVGAAIGGSAAATGVVTALFPFSVSYYAVSTGTYVAASTSVVGGAAFAGAAAVIIVAIAASVMQGLSVVEDAQIPIKLDEAIVNARQPVDLQALIQTDAPESGKQELFATFLESRMPAPPITIPVPNEPSIALRVRLGNSNPQSMSQFQLKDWDNNTQTVELFRNGFIITNSMGVTRYSLDVDVIGADGVKQTVWLKGGNQFIVVNGNQAAAAGATTTTMRARFSDGTDATLSFPGNDESYFTPGPSIIMVKRSSGVNTIPWAQNIALDPGMYFDVSPYAPGPVAYTAPDYSACPLPPLFLIGGKFLLDGPVTVSSDGVLRLATSGTHCGTTSPYYVTLKDSNGVVVSPSYPVTVVVNSPPEANDDNFVANWEQPLKGNILRNDTDVEGANLNAALISWPEYGSVTLDELTGEFTYTPRAAFSGIVSFTYRTGDWIHVSERIATVTIRVNDPPFALDDYYTIKEDAVLNGNVLANDSDYEKDPLNSALIKQAAHGTVTLAIDGSFIYTPNANYHGNDSFIYQAGDWIDLSRLATVHIKIDPVNDAPVANNDSYTVVEDTVLSGNVLTNDTDADKTALNSALVDRPAHGTVTLAEDGSFTYTPNPNYSGADSFTYRAGDWVVVSNLATVAITVANVNDAPVANDDNYTVLEDTVLTGNLLDNDTDPDSGARLNIGPPTEPAHGELSYNTVTGQFTYTPDANYSGPDSFTYRTGDYSLVSNWATVSITVMPVNDAPSFTLASSQIAVAGSSPQSFPNLVTDISAGPGESEQTVQFTVTMDQPEWFSVLPTIDSSGTLRFTTAANAGCGAYATGQVIATDSGSPAQSSPPQSLRIAFSCATTTTLSLSSNPAPYGTIVRVVPLVTTPGGDLELDTLQLYVDGELYAEDVYMRMRDGIDLAVLPVGAHTIEARFVGSELQRGSTAETVLTVTKLDTTTSFTTSANPARVGEAITFRATVTAVPGQTPVGIVTFLDGEAVLGTATLSDGKASLTTSALSAGSHVIRVRYEGADSFHGSTSAPATQVVRPASSVTLTVSTPSSIFGQPITLSASVGGAAKPTGSVTFYDGSTALGTRTVRNGAASLEVRTLAVGSHTLTAVYGGSADLDGSVSPGVAHSVSKAQTTAVLEVNPATTSFGQTLTLTATITAVAPGGGTPSGSVSFYDGTTLLGTKALGGNGRAVFNISTLGVGSHSLRAEYSGGESHNSSTSAATDMMVSAASTTTSLSSSATSAVTGQRVTLTARVAVVAPGKGTPTGSVIFRDGSVEIATVALSGGRATQQVTLAVGSHSLTAEFVPSTQNFGASTGATELTVNKAATTVTLTSSGTPSQFGRKVTFTATVRVISPGAGTLKGAVTFRDGETVLATVPLNNGRATFATSSLARGSHTITASYDGDESFSGATSSPLIQQVN